MPSVTIDVNEFWRGVSTSNFLPDGGYSPEDKGQNLYVNKGLLWPQPLETDVAALNEEGIVASGLNIGETLTPVMKGVVAGGGDGHFYSFNGSGTPTLKSTDTGRDYSEYKSDLAFYKDEFYVTSTTDVAKLDFTFGSPDYSWWKTTLSNVALNSLLPHQLLVFNNILYNSDGQFLKSWDGTTSDNAAFTIQEDYKITAITEYQKNIYIAAEPVFNASGTSNADNVKIFVWDGVTSKTAWNNEFPAPEKIYTIINFNGRLLMFGAYSLYEWTGVSFRLLFDFLENTDTDYLPMKQRVMKHKDRLYFANRDYIICYDGQRFSYLFDSDNSTGTLVGDTIRSLTFLTEFNNEQRLLLTGGDRVYTLPAENHAGLSTGTGVSKWRSNIFDFGERIRLTDVIVQLGDNLDTAGAEIEMSIIDHVGTETVIGSIDYDSGDRSFKEFINVNIFALSFQVRVNWKSNGKPIKSIKVFYEKATGVTAQG